MLVIVVTYGTWQNQVYATAPDRATANKLKEVAIGRGYSDARIMSQRDFREAEAARRRSEAYPRRAA